MATWSRRFTIRINKPREGLRLLVDVEKPRQQMVLHLRHAMARLSVLLGENDSAESAGSIAKDEDLSREEKQQKTLQLAWETAARIAALDPDEQYDLLREIAGNTCAQIRGIRCVDLVDGEPVGEPEEVDFDRVTWGAMSQPQQLETLVDWADALLLPIVWRFMAGASEGLRKKSQKLPIEDKTPPSRRLLRSPTGASERDASDMETSTPTSSI